MAGAFLVWQQLPQPFRLPLCTCSRLELPSIAAADAQVSRRLQRRLHKELSAGRFGYVKLAAHTYSALLLSKPEKSGLLANELVVRTVVKWRRCAR